MFDRTSIHSYRADPARRARVAALVLATPMMAGPAAILAQMLLLSLLLTGLVAGAYLLKSALGIDIMPGPSPLHDLLYPLLRR